MYRPLLISLILFLSSSAISIASDQCNFTVSKLEKPVDMYDVRLELADKSCGPACVINLVQKVLKMEGSKEIADPVELANQLQRNNPKWRKELQTTGLRTQSLREMLETLGTSILKRTLSAQLRELPDDRTPIESKTLRLTVDDLRPANPKQKFPRRIVNLFAAKDSKILFSHAMIVEGIEKTDGIDIIRLSDPLDPKVSYSYKAEKYDFQLNNQCCSSIHLIPLENDISKKWGAEKFFVTAVISID